MSKAVLITGASSGIGKALAGEFAGRGYDLALAARREQSLVELREALLTEHPDRQVEVRALDVTHYDDVQAVVDDLAAALGGLDIAIANAGIGSTAPVGEGHFDADRAVIETNVIGAMATIDAAVALFKRQGRGQVVAISSVAAVRGLPGSASYSASKAAIAVYADAVRAELHGGPITVTTLLPGFIDTPLNQDMKQRPFLISLGKGARIIADLIEREVKSKTVPVFPWNLVARLLRAAPTSRIAGMSGRG